MTTPDEELLYPNLSPTFETADRPLQPKIHRKSTLPLIEFSIRENIRRSALIRVYNGLVKLWENSKLGLVEGDANYSQLSPNPFKTDPFPEEPLPLSVKEFSPPPRDVEEINMEDISLKEVPVTVDAKEVTEQTRQERIKVFVSKCDQLLLLMAMVECEGYLKKRFYPMFNRIEEAAEPQMDYPCALVDMVEEPTSTRTDEVHLEPNETESMSLRTHHSLQHRISLLVNKKMLQDERRELFVEDQRRIAEVAFLLDAQEIRQIIQNAAEKWKNLSEREDTFGKLCLTKCREMASILLNKMYFQSVEVITQRSYLDALEANG